MKDKSKKIAGSVFFTIFLVSIVIVVIVFGFGGYYVGKIYKRWELSKEDSMKMIREYYNLIVVRGNEKKIRYFDPSNPFVDSPPTRIYDRNNELIGEYMPPSYEIVNADDINPILEKMLLLMEDQKFYEHKGVNYVRSAYLAIQTLLTRRIVGGGSTITQQLAKLMFTKSEKTLERKVFELFAAMEIEKQYSKKEILAMYFNTVYLGDGNYGFEAAANHYFAKQIKNCNLVEYAILLGMLQNPSYYSIVSKPDNSRKKVVQILRRMQKHSIITEETVEQQLAFFDSNYYQLQDKIKVNQWKMTVNKTPYANEYIRQQLLNYFDKDEASLSGLNIYTTINRSYYEVAERIMREKIRLIQKEAGSDSFQGALIELDAKTGAIITMIGGDNYSFKNQFNRAVQAKRQIGSTIKPFIYLYAFESGLLPFSKIDDTNYTYSQGVGKPAWSPRNYDRSYRGEVTLETALTKSINTVAVKLLHDVGLNYFILHVKDFFDKNAYIPNVLSLGLGTLETTVLDTAVAYSVLANRGTRYEPYIAETIYDNDGKELSITALVDRTPKEIKGISQVSYYLVNNTLQKVLAQGGTAYSAARSEAIAYPSYAGKTGTTSDHRDTWFACYNDESVIIVWLGSDKNEILPNNMTGGVLPARTAFEYINATGRNKQFFWEVPKELSIIEICLDSGLPRNHTCTNIRAITIGDIDITSQCPIDHISNNKTAFLDSSAKDKNDYNYVEEQKKKNSANIVDPSVSNIHY